MAKKKRSEVIETMKKTSAYFEQLAEQLAPEDSYGRGLFHGYVDALKHAATLLEGK